MTRNEQVKNLRPDIPSISNNAGTTELELFQNDVLRPILKFQHNVLVSLFQRIIEKRKEKIQHMTRDERAVFISSVFQKEIGFRNTVLGAVVGLLSDDELSYYLENKSDINRRISQMAQQRIHSSL